MPFRRFLAAGILAFCLAVAPGPSGVQAQEGLPKLTTDNFAATVKSEQGLVLVAFVAKWCRFCQKQIPELIGLQRNRAASVNVYLVDVEEEPDIAQAYDAEVLPTMVLLYQGSMVAGSAGALYGDELTSWVTDTKKSLKIQPESQSF